MNVTLILYESKYGTGEVVANTICPVLGPAKSFDINDAPHDIKYYSNVVLVFSLSTQSSCEKILEYIENNKINFTKKRVALVCIGLNKEEVLNELKMIKGFCSKIQIKFQYLEKHDDILQELSENLREYLNTPQFIPPVNVTKKEIEIFMKNKNTCTLATGYGDFVRATPLEYEYYDGNVYMISEGGLKFIGISKNKQVSICVYEDYQSMNHLCGLQISGEVEVLQPWSDEYVEVLKRKGLKIENISKLPFDMNVIKVVPNKYEFLYSKFKNMGFDTKQIYVPKK